MIEYDIPDDLLLQMKNQLQIYKVVIVGNSGTGKTNITSKFIKDQFIQDHKATVGIQFLSKNIQLDGKEITVTLWDTAGQERYHSISKVFYKGARGVIVVYDVTDPQSYIDVEQWLKRASKSVIMVDETINLSEITVMIVGNKIDLALQKKVFIERAISEYRQTFDIDCWEVSAKTGENINQLFNQLFLKINTRDNELKRGSSIFIGDSQLYASSEKSSFFPGYRQHQGLSKEMQVINQVIFEEKEDLVSSNYKYEKKNDKKMEFYESRMTLTPEDQQRRLQQTIKNKKRCCH